MHRQEEQGLAVVALYLVSLLTKAWKLLPGGNVLLALQLQRVLTFQKSQVQQQAKQAEVIAVLVLAQLFQYRTR